MKAVEIIGSVEKDGTVSVSQKISSVPPGPVRILLLSPDQEEQELDEKIWIRGASTNPAFDFLKNLEEDIYSLSDGRAFHD